MGEKICSILPAFHSLTGSDFTKPFFRRLKINNFRKLLAKPESMDLMPSMNTDHVDIEKVTYFALHVIYNCPKRDKSPTSLYDAVCWKRRKRKVCTYKITVTRSKVFNYENIASTFSRIWINCLDSNYQSLDPLSNGWIFLDGALQLLGYDGASLTSEEQIQNYLREASEVLRDILQNSEEIGENLTDDDDDVVSDNESESDK